MKELLSNYPWDEVRNGSYLLKIPACSPQDEAELFMVFWRKVVTDLMPLIAGAPWDCIKFTVRPEDGHISVYFWNSLLKLSGPDIDSWLSVAALRRDAELRYEEQEEGKITDDVRYAQDLDAVVRYSKALVEAAKSVRLDHAFGVGESGLKMRFHHYDDEPPLYETVLRTQK